MKKLIPIFLIILMIIVIAFIYSYFASRNVFRDVTVKAMATSGQIQETQPYGKSSGWTIDYYQEFDDTELNNPDEWNTNNWSKCYWWKGSDDGCTIGSNNELQWFRPGNVSASGGKLKLTGKKETYNASDGKTYQYTSGMVTTGGIEYQVVPQYSFNKGYVEIRAKLPAGKGIWPAFWLLPVDNLPNESPSSRPEIDVMEFLGHETTTTHANVHFRYAGGTNEDSGSEFDSGVDLTQDFHVYGLEWTSDRIVWYLDGVEFYRYSNSELIPNEDMYIILSMAIGGNWPGSPDTNTVFPAEYEIDYLRVWKQTAQQTSTETALSGNSTWKYNDTGSNLGTSWINTNYDDSSWKSGQAVLGYGEGDENTTVSYGPDANNNYTTTYFRKKFDISNKSEIQSANISLRRDDGAVVYLNGTEVFRSNMPVGIVSYNTLAYDAIDDGRTFYDYVVDPELLIEGTNVLAVEVHQSSNSSSDMSMQAVVSIVRSESEGYVLDPRIRPAGSVNEYTDNDSPMVEITNPENIGRLSRGSTYTIRASAVDKESGISEVRFYANGELVCTDTVYSYKCNWKVPEGKKRTYKISVVAVDRSGNTSISRIKVKSK